MGKEVFQENYLRTVQGFSLIQTFNRFFVQSLMAFCNGLFWARYNRPESRHSCFHGLLCQIKSQKIIIRVPSTPIDPLLTLDGFSHPSISGTSISDTLRAWHEYTQKPLLGSLCVSHTAIFRNCGMIVWCVMWHGCVMFIRNVILVRCSPLLAVAKVLTQPIPMR